MWRRGTHEQLVEGVEAARDAGRETHEEDEQLLVATEFSDVRQEVVEVHRFLEVVGVRVSVCEWIRWMINIWK